MLKFKEKFSGRRVDVTMAVTKLLEEMKLLNAATEEQNKFLYLDFSVNLFVNLIQKK